MKSLQRTLGRKAVKATVRHSAHGMSAKAHRQPLRSATLLSAGAAFGALVGWVTGRRGRPSSGE